MATKGGVHVYKWDDIQSGKVKPAGRVTHKAEEMREKARKLLKPGEAALLSELAQEIYGDEFNPGKQSYLKKVFNTGDFTLKKYEGRLFVERKAS